MVPAVVSLPGSAGPAPASPPLMTVTAPVVPVPVSALPPYTADPHVAGSVPSTCSVPPYTAKVPGVRLGPGDDHGTASTLGQRVGGCRRSTGAPELPRPTPIVASDPRVMVPDQTLDRPPCSGAPPAPVAGTVDRDRVRHRDGGLQPEGAGRTGLHDDGAGPESVAVVDVDDAGSDRHGCRCTSSCRDRGEGCRPRSWSALPSRTERRCTRRSPRPDVERLRLGQLDAEWKAQTAGRVGRRDPAAQLDRVAAERVADCWRWRSSRTACRQRSCSWR